MTVTATAGVGTSAVGATTRSVGERSSEKRDTRPIRVGDAVLTVEIGERGGEPPRVELGAGAFVGGNPRAAGAMVGAECGATDAGRANAAAAAVNGLLDVDPAAGVVVGSEVTDAATDGLVALADTFSGGSNEG